MQFVDSLSSDDDLASFITLIISVAFHALMIPMLLTPGLDNAALLPWSVIETTGRVALAEAGLYIAGTIGLKISAGLLLLRIFVVRWQIITIYCVMGITTISGIFGFFFDLFQCGNPQDEILHFLEGQCFAPVTIDSIAYTISILSAIGDIVFAVLPIFYLRTAQLDRRTKMSVGGILCLASAGCIATIARMSYIHFYGYPSYTFFRTAGWFGALSGVEISIGLTCLALSTYRLLFKYLQGKRSRTTEASMPGQGSAETDQNRYEGEEMQSFRNVADMEKHDQQDDDSETALGTPRGIKRQAHYGMRDLGAFQQSSGVFVESHKS